MVKGSEQQADKIMVQALRVSRGRGPANVVIDAADIDESTIEDRSWIDPDKGSYVCSVHKFQGTINEMWRHKEEVEHA
jgi:hypothetical protein